MFKALFDNRYLETMKFAAQKAVSEKGNQGYNNLILDFKDKVSA